MFPRARTLLTVAGIEVRVTSSWLIIAVLIVLSFQSRWAANFGAATALGMAVVGGALFFISLLAHEMGHALEARHRGIQVDGVTLFILGGVTEMRSEALRPRDEFAIAAVGPFVSFVAGATFGLLATLVNEVWQAPAVAAVLGLLGWLNVGLAVFNLLPASPLDGGRVLRSGLWAVLGNRRRAIVIAARAGQLLAVAVVALAVRDLLAGALVQGGVNLLVAGFLWSAATSELRHARLDRLIGGVRTGTLELEQLESVGADTSLDLVANLLDEDTATGARPVTDGGEVIGAVLLEEVWALHPQDRTFRVVRDLMRPMASLVRMASDTPLWDLVEVLRNESFVLVELDDGRTTTVTARQLARALEALQGQPRRLVEGVS